MWGPSLAVRSEGPVSLEPRYLLQLLNMVWCISTGWNGNRTMKVETCRCSLNAIKIDLVIVRNQYMWIRSIGHERTGAGVKNVISDNPGLPRDVRCGLQGLIKSSWYQKENRKAGMKVSARQLKGHWVLGDAIRIGLCIWETENNQWNYSRGEHAGDEYGDDPQGSLCAFSQRLPDKSCLVENWL